LLISITSTTSYAFWPDRYSDTSAPFLVEIGSWDTPQHPDATTLNNVVERIRNSDPLVANGTRQIHVLGIEPFNPLIPTSINPRDIIVWQRANGRVIAAQVFGAITNPAATLQNWTAIEALLLTSSANNALNSSHNTNALFDATNIYTRAHAPVVHNGVSWLARHDNVASIPAIGTDWFQVSETWVNQSYPVGSITKHGSSHYIKVSAADAIPGQDTAIWQEFSPLQQSDDIPNYISRTYSDGEIVQFPEGSNIFYISTINNNTGTPGINAGWTRIDLFDPNTIPEWPAGQPYVGGQSIVTVTTNGVAQYFRSIAGSALSPLTAPFAWTEIRNWNGLTGVQRWNPNTRYDIGHPLLTTFVSYNVSTDPNVEDWQIYQRTANWGAQTNNPPNSPDSGPLWRRILRWSETQGPSLWSPGAYPTNRVFTDTSGNYWASVQPTSTFAVLAANAHYRPVPLWTEQQEFTVIGGGPWSVFTRRYHCYTLDSSGNPMFWYLDNLAGNPPGTSTSGGVTTVSGTGQIVTNPNNYIDNPASSPHWRLITFECTEDMVVTVVEGEFRVWERQPTANSPIQEPHNARPHDWLPRVFGTSASVSYTISDGRILFWDNILGATTVQEPGLPLAGHPHHWAPFTTYRTGVNYTYTYIAGILQFWHSPVQSPVQPSLNVPLLWTNITPNNNSTPIPQYILIDYGSSMHFFDTSRPSGWIELGSAWIGGFQNTIVHHFSTESTYVTGDIVVQGTTLTNLYRYFRLSSNGIWQPIDPFNPLYWT
jgi:hypothetical protein